MSMTWSLWKSLIVIIIFCLHFHSKGKNLYMNGEIEAMIYVCSTRGKRKGRINKKGIFLVKSGDRTCSHYRR